MSTVPHTLEPVHFSPQTVYCGDCLDILPCFPSNCVDLIYIDPPFNSNRNYEVFWGDVAEKRAFDDRYGDAMAYIGYMRPRVEQLHRVLKPTGSFYYHCDWHASHYIKVMLDEIFGFQNFRTEIIWRRTNAKGLAFRGMANNHDTLYYYSRSSEFVWNQPYLPLDENYIESFYKFVEPGTGRRYQLDNLVNPNRDRPNLTYEFMGVKRVWRWTQDRMNQALDEGRIVQSKPGAVPRFKRYLDESKGQPVDSIWDDVLPVAAQAKERLGYPTQKPLALLERIIKASSNPGDIVLDAFCGCGTTLVAAQKLSRRFLGIDISPSSCNVMGGRLEKDCAMRQAPPSMSAEDVAASWNAGDESRVTGNREQVTAKQKPEETPAVTCHLSPVTSYYRFSNLPRTAEQLRALPGFEFENWAVLQLGEVLTHQGHPVFAQANRSKVGDLGLDGKIYLVSNTSLPRKVDHPLMEKAGAGERQPYLPVQVKNKDKAGRPDIDSFAHALSRDERASGFFIAWDFTSDAFKEVERLHTATVARHIVPVRVQALIAETFDLELLELMGR